MQRVSCVLTIYSGGLQLAFHRGEDRQRVESSWHSGIAQKHGLDGHQNLHHRARNALQVPMNTNPSSARRNGMRPKPSSKKDTTLAEDEKAAVVPAFGIVDVRVR